VSRPLASRLRGHHLDFRRSLGLGLSLRNRFRLLITFRTVNSVIAGFGPRWNVAERVHGYAHPLWMLLVPRLLQQRDG
jgi:hypothetical protein